MFRSMKGHRPVAQLSSASCDTPHRQHSWASPPDSSSLTSKLLEQPCLPRTNDVSILRFHDYLCSVFTRDELYDRLSSTKPAHRADVHTLQLAAAYANIWVLVERLFQTIVRSRGIDFCTITATIHVVLSRLKPYEFFDTVEQESDSEPEDDSFNTADDDSVPGSSTRHPFPEFIDPPIGSKMGQVVSSLAVAKNHAVKRGSQILGRVDSNAYHRASSDKTIFVPPASPQSPRGLPPLPPRPVASALPHRTSDGYVTRTHRPLATTSKPTTRDSLPNLPRPRSRQEQQNVGYSVPNRRVPPRPSDRRRSYQILPNINHSPDSRLNLKRLVSMTTRTRFPTASSSANSAHPSPPPLPPRPGA